MTVNHPIIVKGKAVLAAIIVFLCLGTVLTAQNGADKALIVNVGDEIEFESTSAFSGAGGSLQREQTTHIKDVMRVDSVNNDRIFWTMETIVSNAKPEGNGQAQRAAGVTPVIMDVVTDKSGHVVTTHMSDESIELSKGNVFVIGGVGKPGEVMKGPGWFLPKVVHSKKPGESWTQIVKDTVDVKVDNVDVDMVVSVTVIYTYTGNIDTLGTHVAGIQWRYEDFTMSGVYKKAKSEMAMSMNGGGSGSGMAYYSVHDNILLCQSNEVEMVQNIDMGKMGKQEVVVHMSTEQTRAE